MTQNEELTKFQDRIRQCISNAKTKIAKSILIKLLVKSLDTDSENKDNNAQTR